MRHQKLSERSRTELVPSARRLIGSLRDIGYDLPVAVADLVDNSIAADATMVRIDMRFAGQQSWIRISDNGVGMQEGMLLEALRFGTRRSYGERDLGKFGLGLKAASLSQCRRLTVASRSRATGPIRLARWDLDHIEATDRWEIIRLGARDCAEAASPLRDGQGTVVLWERLDRVLRYKAREGRWALDEFGRLQQEVEEHLAMVFHRFLAAESRHRARLAIQVNGRSLGPWDPFVRNERNTIVLSQQKLALIEAAGAHHIVVRPFVLPPEARFSSPGAHGSAGGPHRWNRQQGFYFYRNDRMIQAGGWSRLRTSDEHTKLARISIDFPASSDHIFELNVSKTQVRIPRSLRAELGTIASAVARLAKEVYRGSSDGSVAFDSVAARGQAVSQLVRMIMSGVDAILMEELGPQSIQRLNLSRRLLEMEKALVDDMARIAEGKKPLGRKVAAQG
jgi:hypothetical protein